MSVFMGGNELPETRGHVLREWEHNGYNDSDFFAEVWFPEGEPTRKLRTIEWGTTRFPTLGYGYNCVVDATPEVLAQVAAYQKFLAQREFAIEAAAAVSAVTTPGNTVRVVRGRKVPKGTVGKVLSASKEVAHRSRYGTWTTYRTMLAISGPTGWWKVDAENCELVESAPDVVQRAFDAAESEAY